MKLDGKTVLVSGANRGIGKALVAALLRRGVKKICAAARKPDGLPSFGDARVVPLRLDITDRAQIQKAAEQAQDIDLLINNAGALAVAGFAAGPEDQLRHDMEVNYFGTVNVARAFVPVLAKRNGAALANVISVVGLASMAMIGGYSASKAALHSATQALRAELKPKNISVHGIFPGPIDTDMAKDFAMPKTGADVTAENILNGIEAGEEDIFPDPMAEQVHEIWGKNPKSLEKQFAAM